jgi:diphosphomevalonate decarboxylase
MKWLAEAPSNIALIKYMGRKDEENKIPANPSLSYTLPHLKSYVELELLENSSCESRASFWEPLILKDSQPINLSTFSQERFLKHLDRVLRAFIPDAPLPSFIVRSCNNFPLGVGLASSASSFAALTLVAARAACELTAQPEPSLEKIISLSRQGSGSSCRSFYAPWVSWENESVHVMNYPDYAHLMHQVILLETKEKSVSSSKAHQYVKTSPFYSERPERATQRFKAFTQNLEQKHWKNLYAIAWDEFQDMHQLFETAKPAFSYQNADSLIILKNLQDYWLQKGDGPLITMDAGPNIHLLYRPDQQAIQHEIQHQLLSGYSYVFSA